MYLLDRDGRIAATGNHLNLKKLVPELVARKGGDGPGEGADEQDGGTLQ